MKAQDHAMHDSSVKSEMFGGLMLSIGLECHGPCWGEGGFSSVDRQMSAEAGRETRPGRLQVASSSAARQQRHRGGYSTWGDDFQELCLYAGT